MTKPHSKMRLGVVLDSRTMAALDDAAAAEFITRASWARRVLRAKLRELAAAHEGTAE